MTMAYFATCDRVKAEQFLSDEKYNWLNAAAKEYILEHLDCDMTKEFRVQDPSMHPKPCVMSMSEEHNRKATELATKGE